MSLSIENDIATIMQFEGKIVLTPKGGICIREFGSRDMATMLAVYSACLRDMLPTQMSGTYMYGEKT